MLKGMTDSIVGQNTKDMKAQGMDEPSAVRAALEAAAGKKVKHPMRHKNLGKFLHAKKNEMGETK